MKDQQMVQENKENLLAKEKVLRSIILVKTFCNEIALSRQHQDELTRMMNKLANSLQIQPVYIDPLNEEGVIGSYYTVDCEKLDVMASKVITMLANHINCAKGKFRQQGSPECDVRRLSTFSNDSEFKQFLKQYFKDNSCFEKSMLLKLGSTDTHTDIQEPKTRPVKYKQGQE
jgi:hypothetical protein